MAKCRLEVQIDGEHRAFRAGEAITGRVVAEVDKEVTPKRVIIEQIWKTHGRGNRDSEQLAVVTEPGRRWVPGQTYTHEFRFDVPARPVSYHGHLVNVDHYVTASADVKWSIDPHAELDYLVEAGADSRDAYLRAARGEEEDEATPASGCLKAVGFVLVPIVLVLLLMLLTILLPVILVIGTVRYVRRKAAERKLGTVDVKITAETVHPDEPKKQLGPMPSLTERIKARFDHEEPTYIASPGAQLPLSLCFTPQSDLSIDAIQVVLRARESATAGSGTNKHTYHHDVFEQTIDLAGARMYSPGSEVRLEGLVELPSEAPCSFDEDDNKVTWSLSVRIDIPQWPDWVHEYALLVVPAP